MNGVTVTVQRHFHTDCEIIIFVSSETGGAGRVRESENPVSRVSENVLTFSARVLMCTSLVLSSDELPAPACACMGFGSAIRCKKRRMEGL